MTANPFSMWFDFAQTCIRATETMVSTHNVLLARTPIIMAAWQSPFTADGRELSLMVTEKTDAFGKAARAQDRGARRLRQTGAANARDMQRLASGQPFWPHDWMRLMERNVATTVALMALPGKMLAPYHSAVTANDRRLR
ncbi:MULTISPECIES: hypothetical protein [unclassified Sphingobium]|uniref:hypothetical protein n=1 Tax=unclassified Sphingobium TaxID=2611147 RepID=UPI0022241595|nr:MULTISPECIES: hypothetical protein [unclassified Sphingobium]MCW2393594.1 hypothetical protein [Sphingobium sp. B8D3B]MCW2417107.1 hypothetical protein [Sphingobium sp. B8D3C]